jgi:hypothetical protein
VKVGKDRALSHGANCLAYLKILLGAAEVPDSVKVFKKQGRCKAKWLILELAPSLGADIGFPQEVLSKGWGATVF